MTRAGREVSFRPSRGEGAAAARAGGLRVPGRAGQEPAQRAQVGLEPIDRRRRAVEAAVAPHGLERDRALAHARGAQVAGRARDRVGHPAHRRRVAVGERRSQRRDPLRPLRLEGGAQLVQEPVVAPRAGEQGRDIDRDVPVLAGHGKGALTLRAHETTAREGM